jgi:hypothetical protein
MRGKLQKRDSWTDEELEILSYLRHTRHWRFKQIQTSYFLSLSPSALLGAYWRLSTKDRIRRSSRMTIPITVPRNTVKVFPSALKAQPACSSIEQGTSRYSFPASGTFTRPENGIETLALTPLSPAGGGEPVISNNSNSSRYNSGQTDPQPSLQGSRNI